LDETRVSRRTVRASRLLEQELAAVNDGEVELASKQGRLGRGNGRLGHELWVIVVP
jgi:hypothetical protein